MAATCLTSRLEQFNRIAVRIFQLDVLAAGTLFLVSAKVEFRLFQLCDTSGKISRVQDDAVPSARLLVIATRRRTRRRLPARGATRVSPSIAMRAE